MKHLAINLVKFKALQKRLGQAPMCHVVGYLETLWIFAQLQARDGDLTKFTALEIAGWIEFPGDPDEFVEALVKTRWLDRIGDRLLIHDWDEHKPNWLKGVVSRRDAVPGQSAVFDSPGTEPGQLPSPEPGSTPGTEPPKPKPKPKPSLSLSQTIPSQSKPSLALSDGSLAGSMAAAEFFLSLSVDEANDVVRDANKLSRVAKQLDRDFVWKVAWVGYCVDRGFVADLVSRLQMGAIQKPKRYIEKALGDELEKRGHTVEECFENVPASPPVASTTLT